MRLDGKVAIVTGAGRGQGRAVAKQFAWEGARLVLLDLDPTGLDETRGSIEAGGGTAIAVAGDVSVAADARKLVETAIARFGQIDVLYNNAGVYWADRDGPVTELAEEVWDRVLAINVRGVFLCSKYAIPPMLKRGKGVVINVASVAAYAGDEAAHAYAASKSALLALTRSMAQHYGPGGVRVVALAPGFIDTPMSAPFLNDPAIKEHLIETTMLRRIGRPEDIANVATFLASDDAAFVTGTTWVVDGGLIK